jgi:hypothetical protein
MENPDGVSPTHYDVVVRASTLRFVATYALVNPPRADFKRICAKWSAPDQTAAKLRATAEREAFWAKLGSQRESLSPRERSFAETDMFTMTDEQQVQASWRTEALQTLLWSVGLVQEMLPYDTSVSHDILKRFPDNEALATSQLRPRDQLERARSTAELWHWRARARRLAEQGKAFPHSPQTIKAGIRTFDDVVRITARRAAERGTIPTPIDQDFPLHGKPFRDAPAEEFAVASSIAMERHFALNWLCGFAPGARWDDTPTDT